MRTLRAAVRLVGRAGRWLTRWAFTVERLFRNAHGPFSPISLVLVGLTLVTYALYALDAAPLWQITNLAAGIWLLLLVMTLPPQGL